MTNEDFQDAAIKQLAQQALEIGVLKHIILKKKLATPAELEQAQSAAMANLDTVRQAVKKAMDHL